MKFQQESTARDANYYNTCKLMFFFVLQLHLNVGTEEANLNALPR